MALNARGIDRASPGQGVSRARYPLRESGGNLTSRGGSLEEEGGESHERTDRDDVDRPGH